MSMSFTQKTTLKADLESDRQDVNIEFIHKEVLGQDWDCVNFLWHPIS
jgi:hypothetical protein